MSADNFLETYGTWDLPAFIEIAPANAMRVVVLCVLSDRRDEASREAIGMEVLRASSNMRTDLPMVHGHRLSWGALAFLVQDSDPDETAAVLTDVSNPRHADCSVGFALAPAPSNGAERIAILDELLTGIQKVAYRRAYPNAWCATTVGSGTGTGTGLSELRLALNSASLPGPCIFEGRTGKTTKQTQRRTCIGLRPR